MTTTTASVKRSTGGSWLIEDSTPEAIFTPEKLTDEHVLIAKTADEFVKHEVLPHLAQLETKDWQLARSLLKRCADLGLLGTDIPEALGGVALDAVSSIVVAEAISRSGSFGSAFGAQTGLALIPLVSFGTDAQKARYVPPLVSGELVGAYALSESGSGSDALSARARATRQEDGSLLLNGEKMWITNCGFADIYIVFAKVDGQHFTAFIVERAFPGVSAGKEEHKMGLHGSSTAPLVLNNVVVPKENVLGEIGKGHKVAFNVLNYGRFKLGAMTVGSAKGAIEAAAKYALSRKQFGQAIASFGAIKHKLGEMTARAFGIESAVYRTAGLIDQHAGAGGEDGTLIRALEEFAVEASIAKVAGSEMLQFVLDENVQIHGGNGYVADYPAERQYRDARVNRIFEGTNEINRLLIVNMIVKRALKAKLPLAAPFAGSGEPRSQSAVTDTLSDALRSVHAFKQVGRLTLGAALERFGERLTEEQEVMNAVADIAIDTFVTESAVLRAAATAATSGNAASHQQDAARVLASTASVRVDQAAREALAAIDDDRTLVSHLDLVRSLLDRPAVNVIALRRQLANATLERQAYPFA